MRAKFRIVAVVLVTISVSYLPAMEEAFFPAKAFADDPKLHQFVEDWYSKHLRVMGETPLPPLASEKTNQVYRFTCLRTFHEPFCVRLVVLPDGSGKVIRKLTSGKGGYGLGDLRETKEAALEKQKVQEFIDLLERERYWHLQTREPSGGRDGSQWIVEAVCSGRYHLVDRWTPESSTAVGRIGRALLQLADWQVKNLY